MFSALCVCHTVQVGGTAPDSRRRRSCRDQAEVMEAKESGFTNPTFEFGSTAEPDDHVKEHQVKEISDLRFCILFIKKISAYISHYMNAITVVLIRIWRGHWFWLTFNIYTYLIVEKHAYRKKEKKAQS